MRGVRGKTLEYHWRLSFPLVRRNMVGMQQGAFVFRHGLNQAAPPGVVLLEAAAFWPSCRFLGLELDTQQLASRLSYGNNLVVAL